MLIMLPSDCLSDSVAAWQCFNSYILNLLYKSHIWTKYMYM